MIRLAADPHTRALRMLAGALCVAAAACTPKAPASAPGPFVAPTVRLVDSVAWENEVSDGFLRRVEVRTGDRVDTIPRVTTYQAPLVIGDTSVLGFAYKEDMIVAAYQYNPRSRRIRRMRLPGDLDPMMSAPSFSPDGRHIGYTAFGNARGWAVVRTWPAGERVLRSDIVEVPATDSPGGNGVRWLAADTVEIYMETGVSTDRAWYRVRASTNPAKILSADTVYALPR